MYRTSCRSEFASQGHTPSKQSKYESYTPRKRYVKGQQETSSYFRTTDRDFQYQSPSREPEGDFHASRVRNLSASRGEINSKAPEESVMTFGGKELRDMAVFVIPSEPLQDCTSILNSRLSLRKERFKKNYEDREFEKRLTYEDQNRDVGNRIREKPIKMLLEPEPLTMTPRKYKKDKENLGQSLTEKMNALQNKIAKLERMTPQRPSTPRASRISQNYSCDSSVILFDREEPQKVIESMVSQVSERESELLSRVSLGRLVEEEQGESEIELIQDLSYRISSKLKSIIRNFS